MYVKNICMLKVFGKICMLKENFPNLNIGIYWCQIINNFNLFIPRKSFQMYNRVSNSVILVLREYFKCVVIYISYIFISSLSFPHIYMNEVR